MSDDPLPPLNSLQAFEAAGRHESFLYAAAELRVSPGAVSRHVRQLERFLGNRAVRQAQQRGGAHPGRQPLRPQGEPHREGPEKSHGPGAQTGLARGTLIRPP